MSRTILTFWLLGAALPLAAQPTSALHAEGLAALAKQFLLEETRRASSESDVRVDVDALDPRLVFPACADLKLTAHGRGYGRTSVTARCNAPQPWAASLTATIGVWRKVAVTAHALGPHVIVQAADIEMQPRNLAELNGRFIDAPERVIGWTTRRAIPPGAVIGVRQLVAPITVERGDEVRIRAGEGPLAVSMTGTALADGMTGEQIAVRNAQSSRVIRAWVVAPGWVSTAAPRQ